MREKGKAKANLRIEVRDREGKLLREELLHNLVVTAGRNLIRDFLFGDVVDPLSHMAVGTGSSAPVITNATLDAEVFRGAFTTSNKTTSKITYSLFLNTGDANSYNLTEAGIFNHSVSGTMYARAVFSPITKTSSVTVTFTWELTWS